MHLKIPHHLPKWRVPTRNEMLARSHKLIHTSYFGLVYLEGHGLYAAAGGSLFLLAVAEMFLHYEG